MRTERRWYDEPRLVRQLPLLFRLWAHYLRWGPKRRRGGTVGGNVIFNGLRRMGGGHPSVAYYRTITHPSTKVGLTVDLYDFECFNHTLNLWLYDDRIGQLIRWILRHGGVFIDAGANYGLYTLTAVSQCSPIRVVSVEPQHKVAEALRGSLLYNSFDNVVVHEVALGGSAGAGCLYAPETGSGIASTVRKNVNSARPLVELCVQIETLDAIAAMSGDPVVLVKLDLQGVELDVLRGATTLLREMKPYILFEVELALQPDSREQERLFKLLEDAGYRTLVDLSTMGEWDPRLKTSQKTDVIAVPPRYVSDFETYRTTREPSRPIM